MILTTILSFFGGNAFRMLWGEVSSMLSKRQDHKHELERMRLQGTLDSEQHERNLAAIKVQADMQVKVIEVAAKGEVDKTVAEAWEAVVKATASQTGIWLVDLWNGLIRPVLATVAIVMWIGHVVRWWQLDQDSWMLVGAVLGIYVADRTLFKRGK
jgi:hypothetical protein